MARYNCTLVVTSFLFLAGNTIASAQVVINRASTVGESQARGIADVVRSQGEYNLLTSQARVNDATARRQELENNLRQTEVFFERRALNHQQRFGDYPERAARNAQRAAEQAQLQAQRNMIRYGQAGRPRRLTSRELDPITGRITWSLFLQAPEYAEPRQTVDAVMQTRALQHGILTVEEFEAAMDAIDQMRSILQGRIREKRSMDFINTTNFLDRLTYEIRNPVEYP
jgi:hypothetical protein